MFDKEIPSYGDVIEIKEFIWHCRNGLFTDYDGSGNPVKDDKMDSSIGISPSCLELIPPGTTHIVWFNK